MFRRRFTSAVLATIGLIQLNHVAYAQCTFDAPSKAKSHKVELVRAYAECPAPGDENFTCDPVAAPSLYFFDPAGRCDVKLKINTAASCASLGNYLDEPCQTLQVTSRCRGILDPGGTVLIDGSGHAGWELRARLRYTTDGYELGDRTGIDVELDFPFSVPRNGQMKVDYLKPRDDGQLFGPPYRAYPSPCSSLEIVSIEIRDPDDNAFAVPGLSTR